MFPCSIWEPQCIADQFWAGKILLGLLVGFLILALASHWLETRRLRRRSRPYVIQRLPTRAEKRRSQATRMSRDELRERYG